jgi:hypothetical protein
MEIAARGEHVGDIKRKVRVVKERSRCTTIANISVYKRMPRVMINENLKDKVSWLNVFKPKDYIHPVTVPSGMILGDKKSDYNNLKLDFGQYCQVYDGTSNDQNSRSVAAIALRPRNNRGSYYFMSLRTGKRIHAKKWIELPVTDEVT